jgi:uncharacterized protein YhfF
MLRNTAPETSMVIGPGARTLWRQYLQASSAAVDADQRFYEVFRIGDTEASATAGAEEILSGVKTATSALLFEYAASGRVPPAAGALSIVGKNADAILSASWKPLKLSSCRFRR